MAQDTAAAVVATVLVVYRVPAAAPHLFGVDGAARQLKHCGPVAALIRHPARRVHTKDEWVPLLRGVARL